jgi:hypothetical protein
MLNYNERKLESGIAERIYAGNFLKEAAELTKGEIKQRMVNRMDLNQRVEKRATNITLTFSPADEVNNEMLANIARDYMEKVGFGRQPYIVYRHLDTFTPHLHILSTNIRADGSHIHRRHFGGWKMTQVRVGIEEKYGLIPGYGSPEKILGPTTPGQKLRYGEKPTTQAIAEVVQYVRQNYRFRSMSQLNAILRQYNVIARPGRPGSRIYQYGGLLYQALDDEGKGRGAPVKASILQFKPTLKALFESFAEYPQPEDDVVQRTRINFNASLKEGAKGIAQFQQALRRRQLAMSPDVDVWGKVTGLFLVDFASKTVVKGEELGEGFDLASVTRRLAFDPLSPASATERRLDAPSLKQKRGQRI